MSEFYWEDIEIGSRRALGDYTFTEEEIIRFGKKYDPQIFHVDPVAAKDTVFGGLIASGWHTAAVWMKVSLAGRERDAASGNRAMRSGVSPGFEDMKWLKPVRPGMTLTYSSEVTGKIELKSRPDMGLIHSLNVAHDQNGELVFSFLGKGFIQRRPKAEQRAF
jgi:acyl dehydratase